VTEYDSEPDVSFNAVARPDCRLGTGLRDAANVRVRGKLGAALCDRTNDRCCLKAALRAQKNRTAAVGRDLSSRSREIRSAYAHCMRHHPATTRRSHPSLVGRSRVGFPP
jgi:hypothetical protein